MRIMAFRCDYCGGVYDSNHVSGLIVHEPNLLCNDYTFTLEGKAEKVDCHFCMVCHNRHVATPAASVKRNNDQDEYTIHYEALQRNFFLLVYRKYEVNRRNASAQDERLVYNKNRHSKRR